MSKSTSLSSDIDFIKEFEELKLKQKLLVETLTKKRGALRDEHLININSKLDFLVNLFKDANETTHDDSQEKMMAAITSLTDKLDSLEKKFDEKFEEMTEKINLVSKQTIITSNSSTSQEPTLDYDDVTKELHKHKKNSISKSAPIPDFKVEEKLDSLQAPPVVEEKKKRKWF